MRDRDEERLQRIRKGRAREAALAAAKAQRTEQLHADLDHLVLDFAAGDPRQIGFFLADLEARGGLTVPEKEALYWRLVTHFGMRFADEALGLGGRWRDDLAARPADAERVQAGGRLELPANVVDFVASRAALTARLVEQFATAVGMAPGGVFVKADEDARRRTEARGAQGLAEHGTVYLHPTAYDPTTEAGRGLLGHELAHVAQRRVTTATPNVAAAEGEAARMGAAFAAGNTLGAPTQSMPGLHVAANTGASSSGASTGASNTTASQTSQAPSTIDLDIGGHVFTVRLPSGATQKSIDVPFREEPVPGIALTGASLNFDDEWKVASGTARADIRIGDFITAAGVSLEIAREGKVTASVPGAELNVQDRLRGTIDLTVDSEGISGQATLEYGQVVLDPAFQLTGGSLAVQLSTAGELSGQGTLMFAVEGIGDATLEAQYANGEFSGGLTVNIARQDSLIPYAVLESGQIQGQYQRGQFTLSGQAALSIPGVVRGEFQATYEYPAKTLSGTASLHQEADVTLGDLTISQAEMTATVANNALTQVTAGAHIKFDRFEGDVRGTYDAATQTLSGRADFAPTEDIAAGNVTLLQDGTHFYGQVEASKVTAIGGQAHLKVSDEGGELADVQAVAEYKPQEDKISGQGVATLSRSLEFGDDTGKIVIDQGAQGNLVVQDSQVISISGALTARVQDAQGELATGSLSGEYLAQEKQFSGTGTVTLSRDINLAEGQTDELVLQQGATVTATVEANQVKTISGECALTYKRAGQEVAKGNINGTYQFQEKVFDGSGQATLVADLEFPGSAGDKIVLLKDSTVSATVAQSKLTTLELTSVAFRYDDAQGELCNGTVAGTYTAEGEQVNGSATVNLARDIPLGSNPESQLVIKQGATGTIEVAQSKPTTLTAQAEISYNDGQGELIHGSINGTYTFADQKFSGSGTATLMRDVEVNPDGSYKVSVLQGSTATANVSENALQNITGTLNFRINEPAGDELATGSVAGEYKVAEKSFSGTATGTLSKDIVKDVDGGQLKLLAGSTITANIANNAIDTITGDLNGSYCDEQGELLRGNLKGTYTLAAGEFTGTGTVTLQRDIEKSNDLGTIRVLQGSSATAHVTASKLEKVTGSLQALFLDGEGELLKGEVTGELFVEAGEFSGTGSVTLLRDVKFSEGGYTVTIVQGSKLTAQVDRNQFVSASGALDLKIDDAEGLFITGQISGEYKVGSSTFSGTGHAELARDVTVDVAGKTLVILKGSGGNGTITENKLTELTGTLNLKVTDEKGDLITGAITGTYDAETQKFNGSGQASLARDVTLELGGGRTLVFLQGSGGTATLEQNELKQLQGSLNLKLTDGEGDLLTGSINGTYDATAGKFSGTGQANLARDVKLELGGGKTLVFLTGSGGSATITDNTLEKIEGSLNLKLTDGEGDLLTGSINGTYTVATSNFSGTGQAALARDVTMDLGGGKTLVFLTGSGGSATIKDNTLEKIEGTLNLKLTDSKGDLLTGALNGTYDAVNNKFGGTGEAHLARDEEITLGSGKIVIKTGSGGGAEIKDNTLERVWGTLNVDLCDAQGPLMTGALQGEYKVQEGLFSGTGTATLTRDMELAGGNIIISNVSGHATITENKLTEAGGTASIRIPPLNDMTGTFEINWRNEGGKDIYSGKGKINFTLNERISGEVDMEYNEDDTWKIHGEVELKITEQIKGKIGVEVDQNLDPVMSGTLAVENVELVPARDLFGLKFDILPAQDIPLGIPGLNLHVGIGAGLGATFNGLKLNAQVDVTDFHPLQLNVPNFHARAELPTGMTFFAEVKPAIGITGGVTGLNVGIALEGGVRLNVPLNITPYAELWGQEGKFRGELGIGVRIAPSVTLSAHPYIFATIGREFRYDGLPTWEYTFPELFNWEWTGKYKWGEEGPQGKDAAPVSQTESPAGQQVGGQARNNTDQNVDVPAKNASGASPGGPDIGGGDELAGDAGKSDSPLAGLQEKIAQIQEWADTIAKVAYAVSEVMNIISVASMGAMFGPLGLLAVPVYLAYRYFIKGDLDFGKLADGFRTIFELIGQGLEMVRQYLPDWMSTVWEYVQKGAEAFKELLSRMGDWLLQNLKALGQAAVNFLKGVGEWGANIINQAGQWAVEAAGWVWNKITDIAEDAWEFVTSW